MFFSSMSLQNVKLVSAITYAELASAPLILKFDGGPNGFGEFTVHTENSKLSIALAEAITAVIKQFEEPAVAPQSVIADDEILF
jgi:hypothetical protein